MKKIVIGMIAGISIAFVFAFTDHDQKISAAEVDKYEGLLIFTDCKPTTRYDVLGDVEIKMISSVYYYDKARNNLVLQAKEKFSNVGAEGIIITYPMNNKLSYAAQVIRFKR